MTQHLSYSETLANYPVTDGAPLRKVISDSLCDQHIKIVVLDDDPTGIQTVHDCLLLTNWKPGNLEVAFNDQAPFFYLLTNTRSMTSGEAEIVTQEAVRAVIEKNKQFGFKLIFISRSDSTLRGHFPLEPDTMRKVLTEQGIPVALPTFFIPSFFEAGRYTIGGTHYMKDKDELIPVSETEFARDNVFGYNHSVLAEYILEKTKGAVTEKQVASLSLEDLRKNSVEEIATLLIKWKEKAFITVDALGYDDLWKFSAAFLKVLAGLNSNVVLRTSSSLPKALSGIADKALLGREELIVKPGIGLFVVGSHVKKSTSQLNNLLKNSNIKGIEIDINRILTQPEQLLQEIRKELANSVRQGFVPVVYTSRQELRLSDAAERLNIGQKISAFLVRIVQNLPYTPTYIVAKGGITSHDILTKGLEMEIAGVMGQILAGVPVVKTGENHLYPNMPYIIFPGNVGDEDSLVKVLKKIN
jgi:uncharacterized protein YgbK (DUF1537 family)